MMTPHFVRLVEIDERRFITACRHGLVHVTWGRTTIRFSRDEFRQLAGLLGQVTDSLSPASGRAGKLSVTYRPDEDGEIRMDALVLLLSPVEFQAFVKAAQEAVQKLDEILASGAWNHEEPEDSPPDLLENLRRNPFSKN